MNSDKVVNNKVVNKIDRYYVLKKQTLALNRKIRNKQKLLQKITSNGVHKNNSRMRGTIDTNAFIYYRGESSDGSLPQMASSEILLKGYTPNTPAGLYTEIGIRDMKTYLDNLEISVKVDDVVIAFDLDEEKAMNGLRVSIAKKVKELGDRLVMFEYDDDQYRLGIEINKLFNMSVSFGENSDGIEEEWSIGLRSQDFKLNVVKNKGDSEYDWAIGYTRNKIEVALNSEGFYMAKWENLSSGTALAVLTSPGPLTLESEKNHVTDFHGVPTSNTKSYGNSSIASSGTRYFDTDALDETMVMLEQKVANGVKIRLGYDTSGAGQWSFRSDFSFKPLIF